MIRGLKGLVALGALAALGAGLRWATADSVTSASTQDLTSMAALTVGAVAWVAYCWLLIAVFATVLAQLPGAVGRAASVVGARITSPTSRALLRSALGIAAVTPLTIGVAHATPRDDGSQPPRGSAEPQSSVRLSERSPADWRATEKTSSIRLTDHPSRTSQPVRRTTAAEKPAPLTERPTQTPDRPTPVGVPDRPTSVGVPDRPTQGAPTRYTDLRTGQLVRAASRVVKPGESLWEIAAAELGATAGDRAAGDGAAGDGAVAKRWPQWYAANRAVIGPDPDLILPGQALRIPAAPATDQPVPPTHQEK
jgi:nucleoid-associated protein YgaU